MSTPDQRMQMARAIVNFEARRDSKGHLKVYYLPKNDGGGRYEVAGINERFNKAVCDELVRLVEAGQFDRAESLAVEFVASDTDVVVTWSSVPAVESYLRDSVFNRGHAGGAKILQMALGLTPDGVVGPITRTVVQLAEQNALQLLSDLRAARERYEREVIGVRQNLWKGLVNRWNNALKVAKSFLPAPAAPFSAHLGRAMLLPLAFDAAERNDFLGIEDDHELPLPALRLGTRGALVRAWQLFLIGEKCGPIEISGVFDDKTEAATRQFQTKNGLTVDGVAGRETLRRAMDRGFELIEEPAADASGSNFPPRPDFPPLVSNLQRQSIFGAYQYVADPSPDNKERIRILGTWRKENIVEVPIAQLKKTAIGDDAPSAMQFHRLGAAQLRGLWKAWQDAGLLDRILSYGGAFAPRFVRGSTRTLSNHAFGSAFDINVKWNSRGHRPALVGEKGSVRELIAIANTWGFWWGGHFKTPDGMHFELALVRPEARALRAPSVPRASVFA